MGKRKLNGMCFFQCEWTGFPMRVAHCYMPTWAPSGKLIKKGSYCNWESVVAMAAWQLERNELTADEHTKIMEHVELVTGVHVDKAPHYEQLLHVKGGLDATNFHVTCSWQKHPITAVKISPDGQIFELLVQPVDGVCDFEQYLHKPYSPTPLSSFHSMRKKGASKTTDRDLTVWYYPTRDLAHNQTASNLFKMQLYGDVLLVQQSREASFMPRDRFVSLNRAQFDEQFTKKRRKSSTDAPSLSTEAYDTLKEQMQATLNSFEEKASAQAVAPRELSRVVSMAPTGGQKLAAKMKERRPPAS